MTATNVSVSVQNFPEIVFGLVGAIGADLTAIQKVIRSGLRRKVKPQNPKMKIEEIKIIDCIPGNSIRLKEVDIQRDIECENRGNALPKELEGRVRAYAQSLRASGSRTPEDAGVRRYVNMLQGDVCRNKIADNLKNRSENAGENSGVALFAVSEIQKRRESILQKRGKPDEEYAINTVYILHSLKHPDEVKVLRAIYGSAFILVGVYKEEDDRRVYVKRQLDEVYQESDAGEITEYFIKKDFKDSLKGYGQNVRDTFPLADLFINESAGETSVHIEVDRFIELLFSNPLHTPTKDEYAMYHAYAASIRSSAPGRQVGAAITNHEGEILALGTNETAKPGGGHYWYGDDPDRRAINETDDPNTREKRKIAEDLYQRLKSLGFLKNKVQQDTFNTCIDASRIADITEFDRTMHAETSALSLAGRAGVSVKEGTLYSTTFPCHLCAKHIITAGIRRVVYVEPYPKSKASELYPEAFGKIASERFTVTPFIGIGPRLFYDLFSVFTSVGREINRKDKEGKIIQNPQVQFKLPTRALSQSGMEALHLEPLRKALRKPVQTRKLRKARRK